MHAGVGLAWLGSAAVRALLHARLPPVVTSCEPFLGFVRSPGLAWPASATKHVWTRMQECTPCYLAQLQLQVNAPHGIVRILPQFSK
jgi:hypothetical protein